MSNNVEVLKYVTAHDDQIAFSSKVNYNFNKLLSLIYSSSGSSNIVLLPGMKGDNGDQGEQGSLIYSSVDNPNYSDISNPRNIDYNIDEDNAIISKYNGSEWDTLIDIKQLIGNEVAQISIESAFARFVDDDALIVYPTVNFTPYSPTEEEHFLLNNFDLRTDYSSDFDRFKYGILNIFNDLSKTSYNLVIGYSDSGNGLPIEDSFKLSYRKTINSVYGEFDLSYQNHSIDNTTKHSGVSFIFNKKDATVTNSKLVKFNIGGGIYLSDIDSDNDSTIDGISITGSSGKLVQIGISGDYAIIGNNTLSGIKFSKDLLPENNGVSIGGNNNYFNNLYSTAIYTSTLHISGNIATSDLFIGDVANTKGIHVYNTASLTKVGINVNATYLDYMFNVNTEMGFTFNSTGKNSILVAKSASDGVKGNDLYVVAGAGATVDGNIINNNSRGGDVYILSGAGGLDSGVGDISGKIIIAPNRRTGAGADLENSVIVLGDVESGNSTGYVGVHTFSPKSGLHIGKTLSYSYMSKDGSSVIISDGAHITYYVNNVSSTNTTFTIASVDNKDGRILIIKNGDGSVSDDLNHPSNINIICDGAYIEHNTNTNGAYIISPFGYIMLQYEASINVWHTISHYGVEYSI